MTLRERQSLFARLLSVLLHYVESLGWELTLGDGHVEKKVGHMAGSLHYVRLAQDLNLFVDGEWIQDGKAPQWLVLGRFWESLHPECRWGGRFGGGKSPREQGGDFTGKDSNHFSVAYSGKA